MSGLEDYPLLEYNEEKGCFQVKGTLVTLPSFAEVMKHGVTRTKLTTYLGLDEEQITQVLLFFQNEVGITFGGLRL